MAPFSNSPASNPPKRRRAPAAEPDAAFLDFIRQGRKTLLVGHQHPDGDAVGSMAALAHGLRALGQETVVGLSGLVGRNLAGLMRPPEMFRSMTFGLGSPGRPGPLDEFDQMILVDCQSLHRVWPEAANVPTDRVPPFAAVDHHHVDQEPAHWRRAYLDRHAAASGELVFRILKKLGVSFTQPIVDCLLSALVSDTGSFSQGNATPESLRQAAELVGLGGDLESVNQSLKRNWTLSKFRLFSAVMSTLRLECGGRAGIMILDERMLKEAGAELTEAEGLVEQPLYLAGVDLAVLAKIDGAGRTRVSLRSRPGVDARALAASLGGGGHTQAAAYLDDSSDPRLAVERLLVHARQSLSEPSS